MGRRHQAVVRSCRGDVILDSEGEYGAKSLTVEQLRPIYKWLSFRLSISSAMQCYHCNHKANYQDACSLYTSPRAQNKALTI